MAVTLEQAVEQLDTELRKARQELAQAEAAKRRIWDEVADAKRKAADELRDLKQQTEQEKARILSDLPALRQEKSAAEHSLSVLKSEVVTVKRQMDEMVEQARNEQQKAGADARRTVDDANAKLSKIKSQFQEFVRSLPPAL